MSNVQSTSIAAFYGEVIPTLGKKHEEVLRAFEKKESFSNAELADYLGWSINRITPRVLELRNKGLVVFDRERRCNITGRNVKTWKSKDAPITLF